MNKNASTRLMLIISMLIFGTIGIFVKYIPLPSSFIALVRGAVGTLFLLILTATKKTPPSLSAIRKNLGKLILSGIFLGANWILLFESYKYTTVAAATLCYYLAPVFIIFASPFVLGEKLTPTKIVLAFVALLGMILVSGVIGSGAQEKTSVTGILLGIGAAVLYASIILLNKKLDGISSYDTTMSQLAISALVLLPYVLITENVSGFEWKPLTVALLIIVGIVHTGIAYALYFGAVKLLPAQTSAIFSYIDPVTAIILSALILGEIPSALTIIGAVLILGSTLLGEIINK